MHSAFNLLVPNSMFTPLFFLYERAMCSPEKWHLKITIIINIINILTFAAGSLADTVDSQNFHTLSNRQIDFLVAEQPLPTLLRHQKVNLTSR